jgi:type IV pilus assembly protein PilO
MQELIDKILKLKTPARIGLTLGLMALVGGMYTYLFYLDLSDDISGQKASQNQLKVERQSYEQRKVEYLAYRNELNQLQEEQRELLKVLPRKDEIPTFLQNVQDQAELSGVEMTSFNLEQEVPSELYVKIPSKMEVRGTFHSITKFFKNISELKRIVTIENLSLSPDAKSASGTEAGRTATRLRARFVVATYRYLDQGEGS